MINHTDFFQRVSFAECGEPPQNGVRKPGYRRAILSSPTYFLPADNACRTGGAQFFFVRSCQGKVISVQSSIHKSNEEQDAYSMKNITEI